MDSTLNEETPDIDFSADDEETPDIDFAVNEETPDNNRSAEMQEVDIDDLDEPDQYVEPDDDDNINEVDGDTELTGPATKKDKTVDNRLLRLPLARVKHIMKLDPDVAIISQECSVLVTKATELFIESLTREAFTHTAQAKKKIVQKKDVDLAVGAVDALMFLEGAMNF